MYPYITVFDHSIPLYGIMIAVGVLVCLLYFRLSEPRRDFPPADAELALVYCVIGIFVGAKLLFLLTNLPQFIADLPYLFTYPELFIRTYFGSGFVFYGGFYGGVAAAAIYCKVTKLSFWELARSIVPLVPLFHMCGRIGCFLAGCCYGVENDVLGIAFTSSEVAPNGVPLLPVQLYEAAGEAVLFVLTALIVRRPHSGPQALSVWLIGYGVLRFLLEFLRGDDYRGFIGPLSISQVIALASIAWGIYILCRMRSKRRMAREGGEDGEGSGCAADGEGGVGADGGEGAAGSGSQPAAKAAKAQKAK